jgi:hypothetical protein
MFFVIIFSSLLESVHHTDGLAQRCFRVLAHPQGAVRHAQAVDELKNINANFFIQF